MKTAKLAERFLVDSGKHFRLKDFDPADTGHLKSKEHAAEALQEGVAKTAELQDKLYAQDTWTLLLIFQAMDAAGKDGAIKHVMSGVNPQGCEVHSFKAPSEEELQHDFLWRTTRVLPERGHIGIFNRSYYEEVLVVRVHAELLKNEKIPPSLVTKKIWDERFEDICGFERHMERSGTVIRKFFLNVSKEEQKKRFLRAAGRAGEKLEIFRRRRPRAPVLGRLSKGVRGHDRQHGEETRALVRRAGGQQMVHAAGDIDGHRGHIGIAAARVSESECGEEERTRSGEKTTGEGVVPGHCGSMGEPLQIFFDR